MLVSSSQFSHLHLDLQIYFRIISLYSFLISLCTVHVPAIFLFFVESIQ